MKIGIVGWGVEGKSAWRYLGPEHDYLICSEEPRDNFPPNSDKIKVQFLNQQRSPGVTGNVDDLSYLTGIEECDKIIFTGAAAKNLEKLFPARSDFWQKAANVYEIFFEEVKTKNIIGITGTKGKGTTSTLTAKMLEAAGKKVFLGGNIGKSPLDFVRDVRPEDYVVLELANFQLYSLKRSPHIGVCLMISEEHLDWHPTMEDYVQAKANMFRHQTKDDIAIYLGGNEYCQTIAGASPGTKIPYMLAPGAREREDSRIVVGEEETEILKTGELKLLGKHNVQNACAALTAFWQVSQDTQAAKSVLASFSGLEHRLEFVRELDHVSYYDDSFGTTPDTAIVALQAFPQPAVLIVGGWDKGVSFDKLVDEIAHQDRVRHVIAIGQVGPKIAAQLRSSGFNAITEGLTTMPEMVAAARAHAQPGDVVLLSCAASSFGLFKDYKERGNQFKEVVRSLS